MTQDYSREAHQLEEPSENSYLEIRKEKLGWISVRGWAVPPFLSTILIVLGPGATIGASARGGFPTWATLIVVGVQVSAALAMVILKPCGWIRRQ